MTPTGSPPPGPASPVGPDLETVLQDPAAILAAVRRATGEYIAVVDAQGVIRACNRVDEGFTVEQVIGHRLTEFTLPESSVALDETLRRAFLEDRIHTVETTVRRLDGELSYFSLRIAPLKRDGRTVAVLVCCENIRPLKDSEQALTRERNVLRRLLEIQERERQLVSYEIHDGVAQYLAGAIMHLQAAQVLLGDGHPGGRDLREGTRLLQAAADETRRLIGGLRPPALDELGITEAIESLVDDARAEVRSVVFRHDLPGPRLPPAVETTVFRIVQESLSNVRKHARARAADIELTLADDMLLVRVADDGRGFEPALVPDDRFGLEGIRQRARLLGGESRIESAPGRGTTVTVRLPVPPA